MAYSKFCFIAGNSIKQLNSSKSVYKMASSDSIIVCKSYEELNTQIDNNPDVVIDFYADWCRPCKSGAPLYEERSRDCRYQNIKFIKVNIDNIRDYLGDFEVTSIPVLIRYKNGKLYKKITGLNDSVLDDILS